MIFRDYDIYKSLSQVSQKVTDKLYVTLESIVAIVENALDRGKKLKEAHSGKFYALSYGLGGAAVLAAAVFFFCLSVYFGAFGEIPHVQELHEIEHQLASEVLSHDGQLLGKYYIENRTFEEGNHFPPHLINALVATEDARFYKHHGVDFRSLCRVFVKSILLGQDAGGGSTISQQLAKNLFPRQDYGALSLPIAKIKEMVIANRLEKIYTKQEILELYFNTVHFGGRTYGIKAAAQKFFNTSPACLDMAQSAALIGMLKGSTVYNPYLNPERSLHRRNVVLNQMVKYDYLTAERRDEVKETPTILNYQSEQHFEGPATYFREHLRKELQERLADISEKEGKSYDLYTDGLKVYTTLDSRMQDYAEQAVNEHMASLQETFDKHWHNRAPWEYKSSILTHAIEQSLRYQRLKKRNIPEDSVQKIMKTPVPMKLFSWKGEVDTVMSPLDSIKYHTMMLHAGFLVMEPQTGMIKAWVGGINQRYFQYDHVTAKRQVGSTFKPIVYTTALENGYQPCEFFENERSTYGEYASWSPRNADGKYGGQYSLKGALAQSVNTVTAELTMKMGPERVRKTAMKMGFNSPIPQDDPSISLGTASASVLEMSNVFSVLANRGKYVKPVFIKRIEDQSGKVLYEYSPPSRPKQVIRKTIADKMVYMLRQVVDGGTASRLRYRYGLRQQMGGKTGTTQHQADGWFIGLTPDLVGSVWVGANDPRIHFRTMNLGQGATTALPIWGIFMQKLSKDIVYQSNLKHTFARMDSALIREFDCLGFKSDSTLLVEAKQKHLKYMENNNWISKANSVLKEKRTKQTIKQENIPTIKASVKLFPKTREKAPAKKVKSLSERSQLTSSQGTKED